MDLKNIDENEVLDPFLVRDKDMPHIEDVDKSTKKYIKELFKNNKSSLFVFSFILIFIMLLAYTVFDLFGVVVSVFITLGLIRARIESRIKRQFTKQFGASIGFLYSDFLNVIPVGSKLFSIGDGQRIFDVLTGVHDGFPMKIFSFQFTVGSGKNSSTYVYTVFEVTLKNKVPNISLYSNTSRVVASSYTSKDVDIELEGDFHKHFKLYVPKDYEMEAYQIFTPNVMEDLINSAKDYNFEFVSDHLYVYADHMIKKREKMDEMFALVTYLDDLFCKNARGIDM